MRTEFLRQADMARPPAVAPVPGRFPRTELPRQLPAGFGFGIGVAAGGGFGFGAGGAWDHYWQDLAIRAETDCLVRGARTHGLGQGYRWWHCSYCQHDIREQDLDTHLKKEKHVLFQAMTSEGVIG